MSSQFKENMNSQTIHSLNRIRFALFIFYIFYSTFVLNKNLVISMGIYSAIGNLIRGRGTKAGSQGTGDGIGNNGDPLGGDGNGDSKVGIDRRLIGYIPGTMGRGGAQPSHNCSASGSITIAYTVDKAGNISSARRAGGVSDPCVVSTSVAWVKKYVKAERASVSSTGTYNITF